MKYFAKFSILLIVVLAPIAGFTHGVHDSGAAKPQWGGVLESLETIHLEFVQIKDEIRIYIYDKSKKPQPLQTKGYPVSAKAKFPKGKKDQAIKLTSKGTYWTTKFKAPKTHRYDFELTIEQGGHTDKVVYTVERKR